MTQWQSEALTALSCAVLVNGAAIADDGASYLADFPTVLSGLTLTWGRDSNVDQPAASTLTFDVAERPGKRPIYDVIHVGYSVDVEIGASTEVAPPGTYADVAEDGTFMVASAATRFRTAPGSSATVEYINHYLSIIGGNQTLRQNRFVRIRQASVLPGAMPTAGMLIPIAPFSEVSTGWDGTPTADPGVNWRVTFSRYYWPNTLPIPQARFVLFQSPSHNGPFQYLGNAFSLASSTTLTTESFDITIPAGTPRGWLGLEIIPRRRVSWATMLPATLAWNAVVNGALPAIVWNSLDAIHVANFQVLVEAGPIRRMYLAFSGRITDVDIKGGTGSSSVWTVTAQDWTADMENDNIGDEPWPQQSIQTRVNRIRALATVPFIYDMDTGIRPLQVSYSDVDSQPVMGLLTDLATTADAVLWRALSTQRGLYLWYEDPLLRQSLGALVWDSAQGLVIAEWSRYHPAKSSILSACDIARDAPSFTQTVEDVLTRVDATWQEQTLNDDGIVEPTERYVHVYDPDAQQAYGIRNASLSTQLVNAHDCTEIATRVLLRSSALRWRTIGAEWDTALRGELSAADVANAVRIVDGATRSGLLVTITDLPEWTPDYPAENTYLEGGTYRYESGRWILSMNLSPSRTIGDTVNWNQVPRTWQWQQFDRDIQWSDVWGLGVGAIRRAMPIRTIIPRPMEANDYARD